MQHEAIDFDRGGALTLDGDWRLTLVRGRIRCELAISGISFGGRSDSFLDFSGGLVRSTGIQVPKRASNGSHLGSVFALTESNFRWLRCWLHLFDNSQTQKTLRTRYDVAMSDW